MDIIIRNETENDYRQVEELTREAFWNLHVPGCDEHYLVHVMRNHPDFIKELDFVAELDGKIVGNIMYTQAWLSNEEGKEIKVLSFGPVSVLPEFQRNGVGSALINHTKAIALKTGVTAILIFGDPHNYCKHGFKNCKDLNISDMNGEYPLGLLVLELQKDAFAGDNWKFRYSDVYNINEKDAEVFEKSFAHKEKDYRYSQEIFRILIRAVVR